jgi:hypothetical protein
MNLINKLTKTIFFILIILASISTISLTIKAYEQGINTTHILIIGTIIWTSYLILDLIKSRSSKEIIKNLIKVNLKFIIGTIVFLSLYMMIVYNKFIESLTYHMTISMFSNTMLKISLLSSIIILIILIPKTIIQYKKSNKGREEIMAEIKNKTIEVIKSIIIPLVLGIIIWLLLPSYTMDPHSSLQAIYMALMIYNKLAVGFIIIAIVFMIFEKILGIQKNKTQTIAPISKSTDSQQNPSAL